MVYGYWVVVLIGFYVGAVSFVARAYVNACVVWLVYVRS